MDSQQSLSNHARTVPLYHYVTYGLLILNLAYKTRNLYRWPSIGAGIELGVAVALILVAYYARVFALTVQDRVIRDEERERLARLTKDPLRARIMDFSRGQLIALRFASDEELPELAQKVLDGNIHDRKAIKQMIRSWRADTLRV